MAGSAIHDLFTTPGYNLCLVNAKGSLDEILDGRNPKEDVSVVLKGQVLSTAVTAGSLVLFRSADVTKSGISSDLLANS